MTSGFADLRFDIVFENGEITSINGYFTGFTLGASFTQGSVILRGGKAQVSGIINYNLFYEGIGAVYQQHVILNLIVKC